MSESYQDIKVLKGLEGIQLRTGMYLGDTSTNEAFINTIWEVVSNSFDEHLMNFGNVFQFHIDGKSRILLIRDRGRGIPNSMNLNEGKLNLELVFTHIHSGGKFNLNDYKFSSGLHGVGLTAVNAVSEYLICLSKRRESSVMITFVRGKLRKVNFFPGSRVTGTTIIFKVSRKYIPIQYLDIKLIQRKITGLCHVSNSLKIHFSYDRYRRLIYSDGLESLFRENTRDLKPLVPKNFKLSFSHEDRRCEVVFNWFYKPKTNIVAFTNGTEQTLGGTHINQFMNELKNLIREVEKVNFTVKDIREGLFAVINIFINNPQYSSQTKEKLTSPEGREIIKELFSNNRSFIVQNTKEIREVANYLKNVAKSRSEYLNMREVTEEKPGVSSGLLPGKLLDCISRDISVNEIFVAEGDSAGGTAKAGRDKTFQAIIPVRGKIINVYRSTLKKVVNFESIRNLILALGTSLGSNFNYEKLRYGKIVLMTDADADGYQIRALLISLFLKYMPEIIERGHLYLAYPPLFRVSSRNRKLFFLNRDKLERFLFRESGFSEDSYEIFKGICSDLEWDFRLIRCLEHLHMNGSLSLKEKERGLEGIFNEPVEIRLLSSNCVLRIGESACPRTRILRSNSFRLMGELAGLNDGEMVVDRYIDCLNLDKKNIERYKGLGQMDSDELWSTVMDPETRNIVRVDIEEAIRNYQEVEVEQVMGASPLWRKRLIDTSNLSIYDLDI